MSSSSTTGGGVGVSNGEESSRKPVTANASSSGGGTVSGGGVVNNTAAPTSSSNNNGPSSNHSNNKKNRKHGRRQQPNNNAASGSAANGASGTRGSGGVSEQPAALDAAQQEANDQMRRALEEDQYSAVGSIVDEADSEEEDLFLYRGQPVRLDRAAMLQTAKIMAHNYWQPHGSKKAFSTATGQSKGSRRSLSHLDVMSQAMNGGDDDGDIDMDDMDEFGDFDMDDDYDEGGGNNKASIKESGRSKKKRKKEMIGPAFLLGGAEVSSAVNTCTVVGGAGVVASSANSGISISQNRDSTADFLDPEEDVDRDGGSIFGQTTGATNSTWVECDKCKKWRRLRGVVDEKKLPTKWFCSMNRNDPERARCSAPEEDYDAQQTPESAADARTRKHLRVWVRRLQCQEAYEARQPTLTRGKKRASASTMKDPYEWVRCCHPSCGKWRAVLRFMDAKSSVLDRVAATKEWYCVMNTWDEKMASCAAPQENLPAIGCPPWVLQGEDEE